jgi:putative addiction module component (TIGR02574 family)
MAATMRTIEKQALALSKQDRARLVLELLDSMDERADLATPEIEQAWIAEAERRYEAYLRGEEKAIPAEEVFAKLRKDDR